MAGEREARAGGPKAIRPVEPSRPATWSFDAGAALRCAVAPPEMTLLDAFRQCAFATGDPAVDAVRNQASQIVYLKLQHLAARMGAPAGVLEDAASKVAFRLMANGPRVPRPKDPTTDAAVIRYLRRSLKNGLIDHYRRQARQVPVDVERIGTPAEPDRSSPADAELEAARDELRHAVTQLFDEIVPRIASSLRAGANTTFTAAIETRRRIALGQLTCDRAVAESSGAVDKQTRNRFDQQQCRALKRLHDALEPLAFELGLSPLQAAALDEVFQALKDMELDWPSDKDA